jgi:hypothetical protein
MAKQLSNGTGVKIGQSITDTVGFYGVTPIVQPSGTAQSAVATAAITTLATTPTATDIATQVNDVIARVAAQTTLLNRLRTDLVSLNMIKGSN